MSKDFDPENTFYLDLDYGRVVIETYPDVAPGHVKRFKELAREKFYDGIVFHRVIDGFMAQTGDPTGTGAGGSNKPNLKAEFNDISHERGIVSTARKGHDVNSANSQFFIVFKNSDFLDGQYTVWGKVVEGMEFIDMIKKGDPRSGKVESPDKILSFRVAVDVDGKKTDPKKSATKKDDASVVEAEMVEVEETDAKASKE